MSNKMMKQIASPPAATSLKVTNCSFQYQVANTFLNHLAKWEADSSDKE